MVETIIITEISEEKKSAKGVSYWTATLNNGKKVGIWDAKLKDNALRCVNVAAYADIKGNGDFLNLRSIEATDGDITPVAEKITSPVAPKVETTYNMRDKSIIAQCLVKAWCQVPREDVTREEVLANYNYFFENL